MTASELRYGFERRLKGVSFDDAVLRVTDALAAEGFGVLTEIDVQKTLAKKLGAEFRRYVILGACNPPLAKRALEAEPHIGLLLPCNVVVQEAPEGGEGGVIVSMPDPKTMVTLVQNRDLEPVAHDAEARLRRALAALGVRIS